MKKLLAILAVMAIAGSALAASDTVNVSMTVGSYVGVVGNGFTEIEFEGYDANGEGTLSAIVHFLVAANGVWYGDATSTYWDVDSPVRANIDPDMLGANQEEDFLVTRTINLLEGTGPFAGTVTFTVATGYRP